MTESSLNNWWNKLPTKTQNFLKMVCGGIGFISGCILLGSIR